MSKTVPGGIEYQINGVTLAVPEEHLTERIDTKLRSGAYEQLEAEAAQMRVRAGNRVLELGSGLGYIASICAKLAGPENVTTVEANPVMVPVIRANLDRNGFERATVLHGAISRDPGDEGKTVLFDPRRAFWAGRIAEEDADADTLIEVPLLLLDDLLRDLRPHIVIMDIEGAEQHLFEKRWPRHVRAVMMELHPGQYPDTVIKKIVDCMSASGLTYDPGSSRGRILGFRRIRHDK